ncbi:hypothetical protein FOZ60_011518 [Perkinsus olseni]|uniref:Sugar phosphate transporter domain-containing protein n=1 Tax=Perkinsus olseni TaxID=32597 RepID=A0A7J6ND54_PEROL|nr:hypothetical protein FOZ60_011518 [Perkinsus olseni]
MTMTNKSLASSTTTTLSPELILFIECIVTCLGLQMIYSLGLANRPRATLRMGLVWQSLVPVTILKAGNMQLSFIAMKFTSLPIYNVLKRLTPLCALLTDWALRGQKPRTRGVVVAVGLLTFGSISAGLGDLDFDPWGYAAALTATLCQSGYLVMAARARDSLEKAALMDTTTLLYYTGTTRNSPLTTGVCGNVKGAVTTIVGIVLYDSRLNVRGYTGLLLSAAGGILYTLTTAKSKRKTKSN